MSLLGTFSNRGKYYIPGYGWTDKQPVAYTDANGQTVISSNAVHTTDGKLVNGRLFTHDGQVVDFGGENGSGKNVGTYDNSGKITYNAVSRPKNYFANIKPTTGTATTTTSSQSSGGNGYSEGKAKIYIAKWKRGQALTEEEMEIVRQYLMRQGTYASEANADTIDRALTSYTAAENSKKQQSYSGGGGGGGGGGSSSTGKNRYKKLTGGGWYDNVEQRKLTNEEIKKQLQK